MKKLVIFDLDGTLLDTIVDLAHSTNYASDKLGYPTHEVEKYNFVVGNGVDKLFERALPEGEKFKESILHVRKELVPYYDIHNADDSRPYPGIPELLSYLQDAGIQITVAPNKHQAATQELIDHYFPEIHFITVFGQREGIKVKPDPTVVFDILEVTEVTEKEILYVGDSSVDMQTAVNARVTVRGVIWRFRPRAELEEFSPQYVINTAEEVKHLIL